MGRKLSAWADRQRQRLRMVELMLRHPQTPWYAKALGGATLLYAVSPIDLIPDFIPVIGHLDDLLLVPLGLWLTYALIPEAVREECRGWAAVEAARKEKERKEKESACSGDKVIAMVKPGSRRR